MTTTPLPQLVYVIRLWSAESSSGPVWRSSVQNPLTGERHVFATLAEFFAFVEETTRAAAQAQSSLDSTP